MKNYKAILSTVLFIIIIFAGLIASSLVRNVDYNFSLFDVIKAILMPYALYTIIQKFYRWISK